MVFGLGLPNMFLRACVVKKAVASDSASPAQPFSNSQSLSAITSLRFMCRAVRGPGTKIAMTTSMITAGPAKATIATMPVVNCSGTTGYEMERSSSEKGRSYPFFTKLNAPPAPAMALEITSVLSHTVLEDFKHTRSRPNRSHRRG